MSGGFFDYKNHFLHEWANDIRELINSNEDDTLDMFGQKMGRFYSLSTIVKFQHAEYLCRKLDNLLHDLDYLVCGDIGEKEFNEDNPIDDPMQWVEANQASIDYEDGQWMVVWSDYDVYSVRGATLSEALDKAMKTEIRQSDGH